MSARPPAVVLGAGVAGLVAARQLRRHGRDVVVFEGAPRVAGLAVSHHDEDGFSYDLGAHFITNRLAAALGTGTPVRTVKHYGEVALVDGRYRSYPTGLLRQPRFVASALVARASRGGALPDSAQAWFRATYGRALADEVALPLVEAWSGVAADELATSVGDKIPSSMLETIGLRVAGRVTRRAVTIGYCREKRQSPGVFHVYPVGGVGALCQALAGQLGDAIRLSTPVDEILVEDDRVVGVSAAGEHLDTDLVVSTAPVNVLASLVVGTGRLQPFERFRFRPMVLVNLKLAGRDLLRDVVVWVPSGAPYFRLTEASQSMPWLAPKGRTMVLCDIGAEVGDRHWSMDDEQLADLCLDHLGPLVADARRRYLGCRVIRTKLAYPVFLREYEADRQRLAGGTGVEGLLSAGRNGEFDHILMEDVYWRTVRRVGLAAEGAEDPALVGR